MTKLGNYVIRVMKWGSQFTIIYNYNFDTAWDKKNVFRRCRNLPPLCKIQTHLRTGNIHGVIQLCLTSNFNTFLLNMLCNFFAFISQIILFRNRKVFSFLIIIAFPPFAFGFNYSLTLLTQWPLLLNPYLS
jgi:hypothetical protein